MTAENKAELHAGLCDNAGPYRKCRQCLDVYNTRAPSPPASGEVVEISDREKLLARMLEDLHVVQSGLGIAARFAPSGNLRFDMRLTDMVAARWNRLATDLWNFDCGFYSDSLKVTGLPVPGIAEKAIERDLWRWNAICEAAYQRAHKTHAKSANMLQTAFRAIIEAGLDADERGLQAAGAAAVPDWNFDMDAAPRGEPLLLYVEPFHWDGGGWTEPVQTTGYWDNIDERWCPTVCTWTGPFVTPIAWKRLAAAPER